MLTLSVHWNMSAETPDPPAEASKPAEGAEGTAPAEAVPPTGRRVRRLTRKERGSYASRYGDEVRHSVSQEMTTRRASTAALLPDDSRALLQVENMPDIPYRGFLYNPRDLVMPADEPADVGPFVRVIENPGAHRGHH